MRKFSRRLFLQLCAALAFAPVLHLPLPTAPPEPYDSSGGQWVFDEVNGLTFPATPAPHAASAVRIRRWRALTFLEKLLGGLQ